MRTNKTASHIYYELDHDVQEYAKRLLAKKILHAVRQDNTASLPDEMAKKTLRNGSISDRTPRAFV